MDPTTLDRFHEYAFPWLDQPDGLLLARSALRLGIGGEWLEPWVERIEAAQDEQGLWRLDRASNLPYSLPWESTGMPSRWVTANAMYVLRAYYGE